MIDTSAVGWPRNTICPRRCSWWRSVSILAAAVFAVSACGEMVGRSSGDVLYGPLGTPNYDLLGGTSVPVARSLGQFGVGELDILDVRENRYPTSYVQRTIYENPTSLPGENYLEATVKLRTTPVWATNPDDRWERPTQTEIAQRLRDDFAGVRMAISDDLRRNGFGVYNHAIGEIAGRGGCVFAWQDATSQRLPRDVDGLYLEFRYCDRDRSSQELVALFDSLSLGF